MKIKKLVFMIFCFVLIGLITPKTTIAATSSEKKEMQRQLKKGEITQEEYNEWLEDYKAEKEDEDDNEDSGGFDLLGLISGIKDGIVNGIKKLISEFFEDTLGKMIISWTSDLMNTVDFKTVSKTALMPENTFSVFTTFYNNLYVVFMTLSLSLLILKTLMYGFNVYILWRNGSPDENPMEMITRYLFAIALILVFKDLYNIIINISVEILDKINTSLVTPKFNFAEHMLSNMFPPTAMISTFFTIIFVIIFIIEYIKGIVTLASKGIELFILRLGSTIAIISATTPQASIFNQYISALLKQILSIFIMTISLNLTLSIIMNKPNLIGFIWATAALKFVNKASSLLSQFSTTPNQGGGGVGMMMQMANAARMVITTATTGTPK